MSSNMAMTGLDSADAIRLAFNYVRGEEAIPSEYEERQLRQLPSELCPYSKTFRIQTRATMIDGVTTRIVRIFGDDEGCVNNNHQPLAECWLEDIEGHRFFYYEA
jgi:hypothetical protein